MYILQQKKTTLLLILDSKFYTGCKQKIIIFKTKCVEMFKVFSGRFNIIYFFIENTFTTVNILLLEITEHLLFCRLQNYFLILIVTPKTRFC